MDHHELLLPLIACGGIAVIMMGALLAKSVSLLCISIVLGCLVSAT